jgi:hypothetical protein
MSFRPDDWLYPIAEHRSDYRVGTCRGGEQMLIGPRSPWLLACFFGPDGDLLRVEERPWPAVPESDCDVAPEHVRVMEQSLEALRRGDTRSVDWRRYVEAMLWLDPRTRGVERQIAAWQREVGFQPGPIRVRRFWLPDREVGIGDGEHYYEESEDMSEEERAEARRMRDEWMQGGCFVLYWQRALWVDGDGQVFAT